MSRPLDMRRPTFRCKCGKVYAMSEEDADGMRRFIAKKNGGDNPVRYYECRFGGWHWTQQLEEQKPKPGRVYRQCPGCEGIFEADPLQPQQTYCGATCSARVKRRRQRQRRAERKLRERKCATCGEGFDPVDPSQRYCTPKCRERAHMNAYALRRRLSA